MPPESAAESLDEVDPQPFVADTRTGPRAHQPLVPPTAFPGLRRTANDLSERLRHRLERSTGRGEEPPPYEVPEGPPPKGLVLRPALLGFVALLAISIGASLPSSPFKLEMPGTWFFGVPSTDTPSTWGVYFVLAAVYGGLLLLMRVWWGMTRLYARCPGVPIRKLGWVFTLWSLPMLVIAPLFSRDVYSYAAQGEMTAHHLNPYLFGPFELGNNAYTAPVDPLWGNAPAPYGPLFLQIDGFFAKVTFHNELATIVLLRLLAFAGVVLIAVCIPRLARLYHRDGAELFTLAVLNPVTILHLVGGAHNDALMLGLLLAGLVAAKERHPVVGVVLCSLATAIKAPAAAGIVYVGWSWLGSEASIRDRLRPLVTSGLIGIGVLGFFSFVSGLGWGWVFNLGTPGAVRSWTAPTTAAALVLDGITRVLHLGLTMGGLLTLTRGIGLLVAGVVGVWLLLNSDRIGTLKALGIFMLAFVMLGPVVQPWYLSWGLILLAPVAFGRLRSLIIFLSMVTAFIELPGASQLVSDLVRGDPLSIVLTLLWVLFVLTVPLSSWDRRQATPAPTAPGPVAALSGG